MNNNKTSAYIDALEKHFANTEELPVRGSKVFVKAIVEQIEKTTGVNVPQQALYKNSSCRDILNKQCAEQGIEGIAERSVVESGQDDPATAALRKYLGEISELPTRNGKANVTQIARDSGIKKSDLYRGTCRQLLNEACESLDIIGIECKEDQVKQRNDHEKIQLERENNELKRKNAALYAEVNDLRRQLKKYEKIEMMLVRGQQIIP